MVQKWLKLLKIGWEIVIFKSIIELELDINKYVESKVEKKGFVKRLNCVQSGYECPQSWRQVYFWLILDPPLFFVGKITK